VHPQRGGLFECLVASELMKARFNNALSSNLYFWRNNSGDEVDLIIDRGQELVPVEIKSGQTLTPDQFRGLDRWRSLTGSTTHNYLVYGGRESRQRRETRIVSWRELHAVRDLVG
jgi:predicted AAA+ superfamily ATPase